MTVPHLHDVLRQLRLTVAWDTDLGQVISDAWDETLEELYAQSVRGWTMVGSAKLLRPARYKALLLLAEQYGPEWGEEYRKLWQERFQKSIDVYRANAALDDNQDNAIDASERRTARGGELLRG